MRIGSKISLLLGALGLVAVSVAGVGLSSIMAYDQAVDQVEEAADRALNSERLNRLVTAVVMDARGIYASPDSAAAKKFGEGVVASLRQIEELLTEWAPKVPAEDRALFDDIQKAAAEFKAFRTETVRLAAEASPQAANAQGNNDANRANRTAFQKTIDAMTKRSQEETAAINDATHALYTERMTLLLTLALGGSALAIAIGLFVARRQIVNPLTEATAAIGRLAKGDYDLPKVAPSNDEVGQIWRSMEVFAGAMREADQLRAAQAEADRARAAARRGEMNALAGSFEGSVGELVQHLAAAAQELEATARALAANAEQTTAQASAVLSASTDTAYNVNAVAAAAEEFAASAGEIGAQVTRTTRAATEAVANVEGAHARVSALVEGSSKIGQFVSLIRDIAEQTNLLALNATIEAARAGEAGRGFAIVAAEVKQLAGQTGRATEEITSQINAIQAATRDTVEAIANIGATIGQVHQIASSVAAAVEEQQAATQEIARNVTEAARGTQQVSSDVGEMQVAANQAGAGAQQVRSAAGELASQSAKLAQEVDGFLHGVRAA